MKSNKVRLGIGWVFLMLLTAAGTFYAADALDQRGTLDKYALHEKFGYARATIASVPSQTPATQTGNVPSQTSISSQISQYTAPNQQATPLPPPPQQQTQPPPSTQLFQNVQQNPQPPQQQPPPQQQAQNQPPQNQQNNLPPAQTPQQMTPQQLYQQVRQQQGNPPQQNQQPYVPPQQQTAPPQSGPPNAPRQAAPAPMSAALRDRLTEVGSRAAATYAQWQPIKQSLQNMGQSLRPEIAGALGSLRHFTQQAQSLARAGDAAGAEHALDMAEKQMQILKDAREN